jgi:beta-N-acetylhexosaminidase
MVPSMPRGLSRRGFLQLGLGAGAALAAAAAGGACVRVRRGGPDAPSPVDAELAADLGETLWVGIPGPELRPATRAALARGAMGGIALFARNVDAAPAHLAGLCDAIHEASRGASRVLIGVDQEGGRVQTIRGAATRWPAMAHLGARADASSVAGAALAAAVGRALGDELAALGVDVDFGPVLDVGLDDAPGAVIGDRAFAHDPATVAHLGGAFARGLAGAGVLACGKHFPGHGGCAADSHVVLPVDARPQDQLLAEEVAPFAALASGLPLLMGAHVAYAGLGSELPGTLDPRVATGLLRERLGYTGVLVSDNLEMGAVSRHFSIEDAALRAMRAGCDALLLCHRPDSLPRVRAALWREARASTTLRARLAQAAGRLRSLKARRAADGALRPPLSVLGAPHHIELALRMAI